MSPAAYDPRPPGYEARLPFLLGCAYLVLIYFPGLGELPGGLTSAHAVMFASLPFWFGAAATRQAVVLDRTAAMGTGLMMSCVAFLICWAFLSVLGSGTPLQSGRTITTLVAAFASFFLVLGTVTRGRLGTFVGVLCLALAFTCLMSFIAYFEPHLRTTIFKGTDRASGFFKNPNQFGMAISTLLPVAAAVLLGGAGRRLIWLGCSTVLLLGLVMSGSKMNLMISTATLVFMLCSYSAVAYSGGKRILMIALSLAATGVLLLANIILLSILNPRALRLLQSLAADDEELQSLSARHALWQESLEQFERDPVFGQGAGHPLEGVHSNQLVTHSHNVLLDYLRTMGTPGFLGVAIVLLTVLILSLSSIRLAFRARGSSAKDRLLCIGLATGSIAYITANFSSDSMGPSTSPFFWVVLFLGLAARIPLRTTATDEHLPPPSIGAGSAGHPPRRYGPPRA